MSNKKSIDINKGIQARAKAISLCDMFIDINKGI